MNGYTINVSKKFQAGRSGRHWFRTAIDSITDEATAREVFEDICKRFPKADGYTVTLDRQIAYGENLETR